MKHVGMAVMSMTVMAAMAALVTACRPSDVLSVPPPAGVTASGPYQNQAGAEALALEGRTQVMAGFAAGESFFLSNAPPPGVLEWSGSVSDEFTWSNIVNAPQFTNIDARSTVATGAFQEAGDAPLQSLMSGRVTLLSAIDVLKKYEPASRRAKIGEAYALVGYTEVLAAEDYCAGLPLGRIVAGVGPEYGTPLTTDSLLGVAEVDFDSALAYAGTNDTIQGLASVGLARARLNRGHYTQAAAAAHPVATVFVYNAALEAGGVTAPPPTILNLYALEAAYYHCGVVNVADGKGGNGLHYVSAADPRLVLDSTVAETCDGMAGIVPDSVWYYPVKFGNPSVNVPLATGVEARLVEAEAALHTSPGAWAADLRALRADSADTHISFPAADSLSADSTTLASAAMQVDVMFRERAFWLYGTGTRLGDMRRLIRQYGRDQSTVFPVGAYPNGHDPHLPAPIPSYGTDVNLTLPTPFAGLVNPNSSYKGCLTSTKVA